MKIRSREDVKEQRRMSIGDTETNDLVTSQVPEEAQVESNQTDRRRRAGDATVGGGWGGAENKRVDGQFSLFFVIKMMNPSAEEFNQSPAGKKKKSKQTTKKNNQNTPVMCEQTAPCRHKACVCVLLCV